MARKNRKSTPNLTERLTQEGQRFSFIQAMRLLRFLVQKESGATADEQELNRRIQVRPELSLNFPGTDITSIKKLHWEPSCYLITATFLGLYGSSSPLPTFYTEDLFHEQGEDNSITRDFLDIINKVLYPLFFRCWCKYHLGYQIAEEKNPGALYRLFSLLGLENGLFQRHFQNPYRLLRYIGLTTQSPRSSEGLRALLADGLEEASLYIVQCVERVATIPEDQRFLLGQSGNVLGENSFIGLQISDRMGKFRIQIGPADSDTLHRFLPDQKPFEEMVELIHFYLDQPLFWDLEITVKAGEVGHAGLGTDRWSGLGWNTWLFSGPSPGKEMSVRLNKL